LDRHVDYHTTENEAGLICSTDSVRLDSFFQSPHPSERVDRAQKTLKSSTKKLEETLRKYASKSQDFPTVDDESVKKALADARSNPSKSGEVFGKFIENVLKDQERQKETVTGKIASCLAKVYPVATFALGLVSFGADVGQTPSVVGSEITWLAGGWIFASENHSKWSWPSVIGILLLQATSV
jgi:hypothetical protein